MHCLCKLIISLLLVALPLGNTIGLAVDLERLQREAAGERKATGPWKQVAAIESCDRASVLNMHWSHFGSHNGIAFLDNQRFALADGQHPIRVFAVEDGRLLRSFGNSEKDSFYLRQIVSSLDGRLLIMLPDTQPQIWDTKTGKSIGVLPIFEDKYTAAVFLSDGHTLATYRVEDAQGKLSGNLQIWDLDESKRIVTLRKSIDADKNGPELAVIGPYLLIKYLQRSQIFDVASMKYILQQDSEVAEEFLFLDPPVKNESGRYVSLEFRRRLDRDWTKQIPQFVAISLPDGREVRRWNCPIKENDENDHRYQALYTVSPKHSVIAISQEGRVNFLRIQDGTKISSIRAIVEYDHAWVTFLDENRILLSQERGNDTIEEYDITSGRMLSAIPEMEFMPVVSPDGRAVIALRDMIPETSGDEKAYDIIPQPLVVLWKRTDAPGESGVATH
jgi:WD40 repeat protein